MLCARIHLSHPTRISLPSTITYKNRCTTLFVTWDINRPSWIGRLCLLGCRFLSRWLLGYLCLLRRGSLLLGDLRLRDAAGLGLLEDSGNINDGRSLW